MGSAKITQESLKSSLGVCVKDFNEILYGHEKWGGVERNENQMIEFRDTLEICEFVDLGYQGPKFTWEGTRAGGLTIRCRLDKAVANSS